MERAFWFLLYVTCACVAAAGLVSVLVGLDQLGAIVLPSISGKDGCS